MSTAYGASIILSLIAVTIAVIGGVKVLLAEQEAQMAADLASISAAITLATGDAEDPCDIARSVAGENGGKVTHCSINGEDVQVSVTRLGRSGRAAAGPLG